VTNVYHFEGKDEFWIDVNGFNIQMREYFSRQK